jgi:LacI family transcriptional regulator
MHKVEMKPPSKEDPITGRITIYDVAAAAGVSKSTVSRILDERLPHSNSDAARRVRQAVSDLGYVRDSAAASLRRGKTSMVGVIVPQLTDIVMAMIYEAISKSCQKVGKFAVVATTDDEPEGERRAADILLRRGVDSLIVATARIGDRFVEDLREKSIPFVLIARTDRRGPASLGDDELGGYLAARHLLDLGHHRIAMIAGRAVHSTATDRQLGFRRAMGEAGVPVSEAMIVQSGIGVDQGWDAASRLMSLQQPPSAIFAVNDSLAIGAMSYLSSIGLNVPDNVSVVGYNDIPLVRHMAVPLSSVRVPFDQIAASAIELLDGPTETKAAVRVAAPTLIPRKSTAKYNG